MSNKNNVESIHVESIHDLLKHLGGARILYDEGILTAGEFNSKSLEYINRARKAFGYEPFDEIPVAMRKQ